MAASTRWFNVIAIFITGLVTLLCVVPFLLIISGSFSSNGLILQYGYSLFPRGFSLAAYTTIFRAPGDLINAYRVTITNTLVGTVVGLFCISMTGYVLSRPNFKYRGQISFLIYFTTIFGGGLVAWYIMYTGVLHMKDNPLSLIIPNLMAPWYIILMRTFITNTLDVALTESVEIDGANHFTIFTRIALPIMKPALATVGLFLALGYWNDWYLSSLFISTPSRYSLQFYMYNMINGIQTLMTMLAGKTGLNISVKDMPTETVKLAMAILATGPVFLFYPFAQRYFVEGITVGSVKG
jgi:putative aldouronate transport system permease protein